MPDVSRERAADNIDKSCLMELYSTGRNNHTQMIGSMIVGIKDNIGDAIDGGLV